MTANIDTICALASAVGKGGVSVVRVSGAKAHTYAGAIAGALPVAGQYRFCSFRESNAQLIDQGLVLSFTAPHSFTGEDVVEFHCHGSPVVVDQLLHTLTTLGARLARPGEFSERAFLNDKLDLTQAEAIADLIDSSTITSARHALRSLQGEFSKRINELVKQVIELRVYIEASIDFVDEEIDFLQEGKIEARLLAILATLTLVLQQAQQGSLLREGLRVVIAGEPNAGKSTLLNALSGQDLAIVTPIPGTTRDILRQEIQIDGIPIHLTDTAGLRHSDDLVEQEGIRRAKAAIGNADRILLVVDAQQQASLYSSALWQELLELAPTRISVIVNKIDLVAATPSQQQLENTPHLFVSAQTGIGLNLLKQHLKDCAGFNPANDGGFTARRRHLNALAVANTHLHAALFQLQINKAGELVAQELREVQQALDEITGRFTTDDLLGAIFSSFCIGK